MLRGCVGHNSAVGTRPAAPIHSQRFLSTNHRRSSLASARSLPVSSYAIFSIPLPFLPSTTLRLFIMRPVAHRSFTSKPPANRPDPFRPPQFPEDSAPPTDGVKEVASDGDFEGRVRFVQWQQARLSDELEQMRRAQAYDAYTRRRFWILLLIVLLCLELLLPGMYYIYSDEIDPDEIPDRFLGLWLAEGEPRVYLRINDDGRVTYHRPAQNKSLKGRVRRITPKQLMVNVWTSAVFDSLPIDGPPVTDAQGRLTLTVDGVKLVKQAHRRSAEDFVRVALPPAATTAMSPIT